MKESLLRFKWAGHPFEAHKTFLPNGAIRLNAGLWRGKEPRSCGIINVSGGTGRDTIVTVAHRPKGYINYIGDTKYDGWQAMMLDRMPDGTLLDGHGQPLPQDQPPVYLPFDMYDSVDFDTINFGEFLGEIEQPGVQKIQFSQMLREIHEGLVAGDHSFSTSVHSDFVAPRRTRPHVKIALSNAPSQSINRGVDKLILISNQTPYLEQRIVSTLEQVLDDYIEGKVSIPATEAGEIFFLEVSDALIDCTPNEFGGETWFDMLTSYTPILFMEHQAKRLSAKYMLSAAVVEGDKTGLLLKREKRKN